MISTPETHEFSGAPGVKESAQLATLYWAKSFWNLGVMREIAQDASLQLSREGLSLEEARVYRRIVEIFHDMRKEQGRVLSEEWHINQ